MQRDFILKSAAAAAIIAFCIHSAALIEANRIQDATWTACNDLPCAHWDARRQAIESYINQNETRPVYVALGDSITEFADLPPLCGRKAINAAVGGATVETYIEKGRDFVEMAKPDFIFVALGTNNALRRRKATFERSMRELLARLKPWPLFLVPLPPGPEVPDVAFYNDALARTGAPMANPLDHIETYDGVHLNARDYVGWKASIAAAAESGVCAATKSTSSRPG